MRPTRATIRLNALTDNLAVAERLAPGSRNVPVVKSNAYGHGLIDVARTLEPRVEALAVAVIDEAVALREAGIRAPLLVLQGPGSPADVREAGARDFWLMLHEPRQVRWLLEGDLPRPVTAWLKVDSGMHRLGLTVAEADEAWTALDGSGRVAGPVVVATHLACADEPDRPETRRQVDAIRRVAERLGAPLSIANSAGILFWPGARADWNRPGYMLYGLSPAAATRVPAEGGEAVSALRPAMTLSSEIIAVRDVDRGDAVGYGGRWVADRPSRIGAAAIGYGDGYPRHAPDGTPVWIRGRRAPLVGTVSMDTVTLDLTDVPGASVGDRVELWGEHLSVNEVADHAGTIGYELLAGLTTRVPRVYAT